MVVNLQTNCHTYQFLYDTAAYCFRSDQCDSFDIYIYNLGVNLFPIALNLMQILESVVVYRNPQDVMQVEAKYEQIGSQLSKIFTSLVDMHAEHTIVPSDIQFDYDDAASVSSFLTLAANL